MHQKYKKEFLTILDFLKTAFFKFILNQNNETSQPHKKQCKQSSKPK